MARMPRYAETNNDFFLLNIIYTLWSLLAYIRFLSYLIGSGYCQLFLFKLDIYSHSPRVNMLASSYEKWGESDSRPSRIRNSNSRALPETRQNDANLSSLSFPRDASQLRDARSLIYLLLLHNTPSHSKMFNLARSRTAGAAWKLSRVCRILRLHEVTPNGQLADPRHAYQGNTSALKASPFGQKRNLSLHEYLSADLLKQVCYFAKKASWTERPIDPVSAVWSWRPCWQGREDSGGGRGHCQVTWYAALVMKIGRNVDADQKHRR